MQRRLAAVLSADIAGFGALVERDEAGTLTRLRSVLAEVFEPRVAAQSGRIVKLMGDGALVEFASVVAAVHCAMEVQAAMAERNAALPEDERVQYRIGVNAGDVIIEGDDIFGEGVNVAARIQTVAQPGGVAISRAVRDQIAGRVDAAFEDLGEHRVKDVEKPVHIFAAVAAASPVGERALAPGERLSVCVLPFVNMSGDPEQDYFSDGVSEDIITDLSKVSSLGVISRNTAFTYKGKSMPVSAIARQLKVTHVLEGSVRKSGDRVRITAQLIEGASDNHVWAERYDRDLKDIFALQDEIAQSIVAALKLKLAPAEKKAIEQRSTSNPEAYKIYLMARQFDLLANARHRQLIVSLCKRAVEVDPNYARAWALMAIAQSNVALFVSNDEDGWEAAERALSLDPNLAEGHSAKGRILGDQGRLEEALAFHQVALRLDPDSYLVNCAAGRCLVAMRRYADAVTCLEKATHLAEDDVWAAGMLLQCYEALKSPLQTAAARHTLARAEKLMAAEPDHGLGLSFGISALVVLDELERAKEWTHRALLVAPDNLNMAYNIGCALIRAGEVEWALDLIETTVKATLRGNLNWIATDNDLDPVRDHPRYKAMMAEAHARLAARPTDPN
ncbi:MAG: TPR end-of-group domain-containing protein [Caulobacteraceae bacterium]